MEANNTPKPIFVVGCPSSGNTLLWSLLEAHPHISCGNETDFLVQCRSIVEGAYWDKLQEYGFDKTYWHQRIAELFNTFKTDYAQKHGKQRWADKTPSYTPHIDFLHALFPDCQVIHIIRDGRDVVMSYRRRWGYKSALKAIFVWRKYIQKAQAYGATMPSGQYMEVRYEDLAQQPEVAAKAIFDFLGEEWDPNLLKLDQSSSYQKNTQYKNLVEDRRQQDEKKSLIFRSSIGTGKKLDPLMKGLLYFWNGQLLKELKYF